MLVGWTVELVTLNAVLLCAAMKSAPAAALALLVDPVAEPVVAVCVPSPAPSTVPPDSRLAAAPPMSSLPATTRPRRSGRLNVVLPSPTP